MTKVKSSRTNPLLVGKLVTRCATWCMIFPPNKLPQSQSFATKTPLRGVYSPCPNDNRDYCSREMYELNCTESVVGQVWLEWCPYFLYATFVVTFSHNELIITYKPISHWYLTFFKHMPFLLSDLYLITKSELGYYYVSVGHYFYISFLFLFNEISICSCSISYKRAPLSRQSWVQPHLSCQGLLAPAREGWCCKILFCVVLVKCSFMEDG